MTEKFSLLDKYDVVEFEGTLIGQSSTENTDSVRWTEIYIYRTTGDQYVIHRVGRSVLYHDPNGVCNTGVARKVRDMDTELSVPCAKCRPGRLTALDPDATVSDELDKDSVDVVKVEDVYERLLLKKRGPQGPYTFMSNPAQRAYEEAILTDPVLRAAVRAVRHVS